MYRNKKVKFKKYINLVLHLVKPKMNETVMTEN